MGIEGETKRKVGRPARYAPGKRPIVTFRVQEELYNRIRDEAAASGRSMSEIIERRVERSFDWEKTHADVQAYSAAEINRVDAYVERRTNLLVENAVRRVLAGEGVEKKAGQIVEDAVRRALERAVAEGALRDLVKSGHE